MTSNLRLYFVVYFRCDHFVTSNLFANIAKVSEYVLLHKAPLYHGFSVERIKQQTQKYIKLTVFWKNTC